MKRIIYMLFLLGLLPIMGQAQLQLDVQGDARIGGRLEMTNAGNNLFIGEDAGVNTTPSSLQGTSNIFIGKSAGQLNTSGYLNTFIGNGSGQSNTESWGNTFIGYISGSQNKEGYLNTFLGLNAGGLSNGNTNVAIGAYSLNSSEIGNGLVAIGHHALQKLKPRETIIVGDPVTLGIQNTAIGTEAGSNNIEGSNNTYLGYQAGLNSTSSGNVFIGNEAGENVTDGFSNTLVGNRAGSSISTSRNNICIGDLSGTGIQDGEENVMIGNSTSRGNAKKSVYIGHRAGTPDINNFEGSIYIGHSAGETAANFSSYNTFVGFEAGKLGTGQNNTLMGWGVNSGAVGGRFNTFYGSQSGNFNTAERNTFMGYAAGYNNSTGERNVFVGFQAGSSNTTQSNQTHVGYNAGNLTGTEGDNSLAIGNNSVTRGSHTAAIGNFATQQIGGYVNWGTASDKRMKKSIKENVKGLDFILQLRPVSYQFDANKLQSFMPAVTLSKQLADEKNTQVKQSLEDDAKADTETYQSYLKEKANIRYTGFIAQEVEQAAKASDFHFSGLIKPLHDEDHYSLRYAEFVVPLVKATQEQQSIIEEQTALISQQQTELAQKTTAITDLQTRLSQLESIVYQLANDEKPTTTITLSSARLEQNQPNPFSAATIIKFYIPEQVQRAELRITALNGQVLKTVAIAQRGSSSIQLASRSLAAGSYSYTLVLDGEVMDTKQMVLTGQD